MQTGFSTSQWQQWTIRFKAWAAQDHLTPPCLCKSVINFLPLFFIVTTFFFRAGQLRDDWWLIHSSFAFHVKILSRATTVFEFGAKIDFIHTCIVELIMKSWRFSNSLKTLLLIFVFCVLAKEWTPLRVLASVHYYAKCHTVKRPTNTGNISKNTVLAWLRMGTYGLFRRLEEKDNRLLFLVAEFSKHICVVILKFSSVHYNNRKE